ncbi:MAG: hypothetical protein ACO1SX_09850, partial [Actinomycetota bacterium]
QVMGERGLMLLSCGLYGNVLRILVPFVASDEDLDRGSERHPVAEALCRRHLERAPRLLAVEHHWEAALPSQGFANAKAAAGEGALPDCARVIVRGAEPKARQWLPWLANELLLQPDASAVGADGVYALRPGATNADLDAAIAVGPPAPPMMPAPPPERASFRQRLGAYLHDWRHRKTQLPGEW